MADAGEYSRGISVESAVRSARDLQRLRTRQRTCKRRADRSDNARDIATPTPGREQPPGPASGQDRPSKAGGCSRPRSISDAG